MRTTIRQVAERAGVSAMTVSSILRGREGEAAPETRERVLRAVRELDYIPVRSSRQSRHVATRVIGVVFDEVDAAADFWGLMTLRGLRQGALRHGYDLLLMLRPTPEWAIGREEAQFLDRRTDGLIVVAPDRRDAVFESLVRNGIPVVCCHNAEVPEGVAWVVGENQSAARRATEYLIQRGHCRIAFSPGDLRHSFFRDRLQGFQEALDAAGISEGWVWEMEEAPDSPGIRDLENLMRRGATAVLGHNDYFALAVWKLAAAHGNKVPERLSVMGMDGVFEGAEAGLTTMVFDNAQIGRDAVDSIVALLEGDDWRDCVRTVSCELVERRSVAPPCQ